MLGGGGCPLSVIASGLLAQVEKHLTRDSGVSSHYSYIKDQDK
jgi:hypothetical protein